MTEIKNMKYLLTILFLFSFKLFGQNGNCTFYSDTTGQKIYTSVSKEAKPIITDNLLKYFSENIKYDSLNLYEIEETKTVIKLLISDKGEILEMKIIRKGIKGIAEQMFEITKKLKWEPAKCEEVKVYSEVTIPFLICLN